MNFWNLFGITGLMLLHAASMPLLYKISQGQFDKLPPLDYMIILFTGLLMMTIRYYYIVKDKIAVYSNLIGVYANLLVIGAITYHNLIG